ncbi:MAG: hypothetical protein CSB46_01000 [Micrococcales bacterium]|nr:MAG: hypothetical protein CSB46_01000 [Micrococcales bacterium]
MLRRLGRSRATSEDGFSLLEVVVALALFMIMSASLGYALTRVLHTSRSNESRVIAANLAERKLETLRSMNPLDIALGAHPRETVTIENRDYFLDVRASYNTVGEYQNACEGASGKASFTAVHIEVSWSKMDGVQPIRSDTTFALPVTGVTATTGVLTIPVEDAAGEPVQNMPVTLTGPTGSAMTATTMSDGCAVFTNVAPSTGYTASVNSRGWVDKSVCR